MKKRIDGCVLFMIAICYTYLVFCAYKEDGRGLSFTSFILWTVLTWISCLTIKRQGGSTPAVPMVYAIGATTMTVVLACKHRYTTLNVLDGFISILVVVCIVFWLMKGEKWALVISVIASSVAGIPYMVITWKFPIDSPVLANTGFLIANAIAFVSAGKWTIKDRLFTGVSVVTGIIMIIPWFWFKCIQ